MKKESQMRKIPLLFLFLCPIAIASSQDTYIYEMSINSHNIGYYYVEYSNNADSRKDTLVVQFYTKNEPCINLHVDFIIRRDTISSITDNTGCVYLDLNSINPDDILTVVVNPTFKKIGYMKKNVYFWERRGHYLPVKLNVFLEEQYNPIAHIKSTRPLSIQDLEEIKNGILNDNITNFGVKGIELSVILHL